MARPKHHGPDDLIPTEVVAIDSLKPHPRNYRDHPDDQVEHLVASLQQFGQFRNVVIARDGTILAGHGVVDAAWRIDWPTIEVRRLDLDPDDPDALKVLALDNELSRFAMNDDRALTELLRDISERSTAGLVGTGYDDKMLANLAMVTRTAAEIGDFDAAAEWVGMPSFEGMAPKHLLILDCATEADRDEAVALLKLVVVQRRTRVFSARWPAVEQRDDVVNLRFDG